MQTNFSLKGDWSPRNQIEQYWSIIRPTVTCGCEMWVLKGTIKEQVNGI